MSLLNTKIKTREVKNTRDKSRLVFNQDFFSLLEGAGLVSFANFFHYAGGELVKRIPDRTVTRITLGQGGSFYLKRHLLEIHHPWQQPLLGKGAGEGELSEGAGEFDNYCLFRLRGLATAVPVAMGEREVEGVGMESFLLTQDFSPLVSLESIIRNTPHLLAGPDNEARRRQILFAAADYAKHMHQSGLNHLDFNATHILLNDTPGQNLDPQVAVFDLQRIASNIMASWRWPLKTLAELNFTLPRQLFSDDERLLLLTTYLGKEKLAFHNRLLWRMIGAKTEKIGRHTIKRQARRRREQEEANQGKEGPRHILIHDQDTGAVQPVTVEKLLRQVPGSREVWTGLWCARPVIVKAFQSKRRGGQQLAREWHGLLALHERGIPAPLPLFRGVDSLGRQALVMERIEQAVSAAELPALHTPEGSRLRTLLIRTLANQHQKGVEQRDLHTGNFLLQNEQICTIDPAEMRFGNGPLGTRKSLAQLTEMGALFPELGPDEFKDLALAYAEARQWRLSEQTLSRLENKRQKVIAAKNKKRLKKYGRKNTRHEEMLGRHYRLLVDRRANMECREPEELAAVLRDAALSQRAAQTGRPVTFRWGTRQLTAYRINEKSIIKRLIGILFPRRKQTLKLWQDLYRQQASVVASDQNPVGLLEPRSPWSGLSSFVIVEKPSPTSPTPPFPPLR